jgi:hypothetical protein
MNSSENPKITLFFSPWHTENVSFQTDDSYKGAHVTLSDVVGDYDHKARFAAGNGETTINGSVRLGGEPAYKIEYGQELLLQANENHTVLVMQEFSLHNGKVYSVRYSAMPIVYWAYLPEVQRIIDSLEYT